MMKKRLSVVVPNRKQVLQPSPGFQKKLLSDLHIELAALCEFGCSYCSSNTGYYLRVNAQAFAKETAKQTGAAFDPRSDHDLFLTYADLVGDLDRELDGKPASFGAGKTLMVSQLTDPFSPELVKLGITIVALERLLRRTAFRLRILTKSAAVADPPFLYLFEKYPGRVVVGLSLGTLDDAWGARVEKGTSAPSARLRAHLALQDAGVATYGMLCPVFPDQVEHLVPLLDALRIERCEHVWVEPFNDRSNWRHVAASLPDDAKGESARAWFEDVFGQNKTARWSHYAASLYEQTHKHAVTAGWTDKLRFLLYEEGITEADADRFDSLDGVLLQSKKGPDGRSRHPRFQFLENVRDVPIPSDDFRRFLDFSNDD